MNNRTHPSSFGVVIGAMKAGSTSLFDYLIQHPEICGSDIKETNYFSGDSFSATDLGEYTKLWGTWDPALHKVAVEASVNYTKIPSRPNVAARIAGFEADWRFIYLLRHPIERIESHLTHGQAREWIAQEVTPHHVTCSMYAKQLDAYCKEFSRERVLVVLSKDLRHNRESTVKRILEFLGVDGAIPTAAVSSVSNTSGEHRVDHFLIRSLRKNGVLRSAGRLVPANVRRAIRKRTGAPVRKVSLPDETVAGVLRQLKPDLLRLRDVYNIDCESVWGLSLS